MSRTHAPQRVTPWTDWAHVTKLDPDKSLPEGTGYADVAATGTDAVIVGGTTGVTAENATEVAAACRDAGLEVVQEPNSPEVIVPPDLVDGYVVPTVLNAGDPFWVVGAHKAGVRSYPRHEWDRTWSEAYVVLNPDSAVARYTDADCDQDPDDVAAFATVAERLLGQQIVYVEYSGTLGEEAVVASAAAALDHATLFYGGGIATAADARTMARHADVVVVGNALYERGIEALGRTVDGVDDA